MASFNSFSVDVTIEFADTPIDPLDSVHQRIYRGEMGITSVSISSASIEAMNRSAVEDMEHNPRDYRNLVFRIMADNNFIRLLEFDGHQGDLTHNHVDLNRQDNNTFRQLLSRLRFMTQLKELRFSNMNLSTSETLDTLMTYARATHILITSCHVTSDFATSIVNGHYNYLCFRHCTFHDLDTLRQIRMALARVRTCFVVIFQECNLVEDQTFILYQQEPEHNYFVYIQEHRPQVIFDDDELGGDDDSGDDGDHNGGGDAGGGGAGDTPMNDEKREEEKSDDDDSDSAWSKDTAFVGPVSSNQFVFETPSYGK
eukprot:scaffold15049_cov36-Cyclotella_meneghiniana.AAC.5